MADLSKVTINGQEYILKDNYSRTNIIEVKLHNCDLIFEVE